MIAAVVVTTEQMTPIYSGETVNWLLSVIDIQSFLPDNSLTRRTFVFNTPYYELGRILIKVLILSKMQTLFLKCGEISIIFDDELFTVLRLQCLPDKTWSNLSYPRTNIGQSGTWGLFDFHTE